MIKNITPFFNPVNNGFVYIGVDENNIYWVRSVAGKWTEIPAPLDTTSLQVDYYNFFQANPMGTSLSMVKLDNSNQILIDPVKTVHSSPSVVNKHFSVKLGEKLTENALTGDTPYIPGDKLTAQLETKTEGLDSFDPDGTFTFTCPKSAQVGDIYSFTYKAIDSLNYSDKATIEIEIV